jgi:hypothetical protein
VKRLISVGEATATIRDWIMKISLLGEEDATNMDIGSRVVSYEPEPKDQFTTWVMGNLKTQLPLNPQATIFDPKTKKDVRLTLFWRPRY